jgi:hypothetical protein
MKRCLINRVPVKKVESIDLRKVTNGFWFSYNQKERGKLSDWAGVLGIPVESQDGYAMIKCFLEAQWDEIEKHCKEDVSITTKLYELCEFCNLLPKSK